MPMINAVGTSLVAVTAFGLTTALNYAFSGLVDWPLATVFIIGGFAGGFAGAAAAKRLSVAGHLSTVFAGLIIVVAAYMLRSEEHTSELQSLMRISYAVFCLKKKNRQTYKQRNA